MGRPDLRLRREIRRLSRRGRIHRGKWLHVRVGPSDSDRILLSVRRKFGIAVLRNRVRRRLRVVCRQAGIEATPGRLLVIFVGDHASRATYSELRNDLMAAFDSLGLFLL